MSFLQKDNMDQDITYLYTEDSGSQTEFTVQKDSTYQLKEFVEAGFEKLGKKIDRHDDKQSKERQEMLLALQKENNYFRRQMAEKYSPRKLQIRSLFVAFIMLISIGLSHFEDIDLIHPILSIVILVSAIAFHIMSLIMLHQDSK